MGSASSDAAGELSYSRLKDLRFEVEADKEGKFAVSFWIFVLGSTHFPSTILRKVNQETMKHDNFLFLNKDKKIVFSPAFFLCEGHLKSGDSTSRKEVPNLSSDEEFPLEKWVHLCCEVSSSLLLLHIDGKIVAGKCIERDSSDKSFSQLILAAVDGDSEKIEGYVHKAEILPLPLSVKDHHVKDPPLQLSLDGSSASEIEEESDGAWGIVGGKSSCRRKFALDVLLLDAFGEPVHKEWEVATLLVYADDLTPVQKTDDGEAPLLASCEGLEFPSSCKPSKLLKGRASFKLKISQLSSKCENRLFRIKFHIRKLKAYPFLEVLSPPIRCISRSRNTKVPNHTWRKLSSGVHVVNGGHDDVQMVEPEHNAVCEARSSPPSKRVKLGCGNSSTIKVPSPLDGPYIGCKPTSHKANKVNGPCGTHGENQHVHVGRTDTSAVMDMESVGARNSISQSTASLRESFTDMTIFKYCLGGLSERSLMLKEAVSFSSYEDIEQFANQVSLYSGCSHHRHQILIAKGLIEEGEKTWSLISQNRQRIEWEDVVFELEEQFMRISCCNLRSLTQQDFNFLRRISGCHEYLSRENFDKLWRWLYPVAYTISREGINQLWASKSPKWVEGFLTKEEVEFSLQNPMGIGQPGTFILRFPTSRSWPHPDAGSIVITYVGGDYRLIHRLLSSDYRSGKTTLNAKMLQDLLLSEPELSRLKG